MSKAKIYLIRDLLSNDRLQYMEQLELLKEFNHFSFEKTILKRYLEFEKTIFMK